MCDVWGALLLIFLLGLGGLGDGLLVSMGCRGGKGRGSVFESWSGLDCLIDGSITS